MNITTKAEPVIDHAIAEQSFAKYEHRRFYVRFDYKNRGSVQVRLEPDNESVYLSVQREFGGLTTATVSLSTLVDMVIATILASNERAGNAKVQKETSDH